MPPNLSLHPTRYSALRPLAHAGELKGYTALDATLHYPRWPLTGPVAVIRL